MTVLVEQLDLSSMDIDPSSEDFKAAVEEYGVYLGEAADRMEAEPESEYYIDQVEAIAAETAQIARQVPEIAPKVVKPLTRAVKMLFRVGPRDYRSLRVVADSAASLYPVVGDDAEVIEVADNAIDEYYDGQDVVSTDTQVNTPEVQEIKDLSVTIDTLEADAHKDAIRQTNENTPFPAALTKNEAVAMGNIEIEKSELDVYREDRLADKAARDATFRRRQQEDGFQLAHTGELYTPDFDDTQPIDMSNLLDPAPNHTDKEAWEAWKRHLRKNLTTKKAIRVAQFNYYDRLPEDGEIEKLVDAARAAAA